MQLPAELISLKLECCCQLFSAVDEGRHQMLASNPKSRERDCSLSSGHKIGEDVIMFDRRILPIQRWLLAAVLKVQIA